MSAVLSCAALIRPTVVNRPLADNPMRSLFWKIFLAFWLTIALIVALTFTLGLWLSGEQWLLNRYPGLNNYAQEWVSRYHSGGLDAADAFARERLRSHGVRVAVWSADGQQLYALMPARRGMGMGHGPGMGMGMRHNDAMPGNHPGLPPGGMQRFSVEYAAADGQTYLFNYAVPNAALRAWQGRTLFWPLILFGAAIAISLVSWLLSAYIVRPVNRLRAAVDELGQGRHQSGQLTHISKRRDELGLLAGDFNRMGERLQNLLASQRQLLRDVSHELRSPLARLRIALGLAGRDAEHGRYQPETWQKLERECDRLDQLIGEILSLSRLDNDPGDTQPIALQTLLTQVLEEQPELPVQINGDQPLWVDGWPNGLGMALSNLLRNAARFNPPDQAIDIRFSADGALARLTVRDHGPGCPADALSRLGEPFYRAPGQHAPGHGLGLTIIRRVIAQHHGQIRFSNHPDGGFQAEIELPLRNQP